MLFGYCVDKKYGYIRCFNGDSVVPHWVFSDKNAQHLVDKYFGDRGVQETKFGTLNEQEHDKKD